MTTPPAAPPGFFAASPIPANTPDTRPVFFFDIDNCLYPKSVNVITHMKRLIHEYFITHLELTAADAYKLHETYYRTYGLALEGLVRHHRIDPLAYNRLVDDALPLEELLAPNPALRELLLDIDTEKCKLWLFTNAYSTHGLRVIRLLGLEGLFEGMTYCDYAEEELVCKPKVESYARAMRDAGVEEGGRCWFVDDSEPNCVGAKEVGWERVVMKLEGDEEGKGWAGEKVRELEELRGLFKDIFKN